MAEPGSTVVATAALACANPATAQQYAQSIYAAFAGMYPALVVNNDPTTAFGPALVKFIHDTLLAWQMQEAALQAAQQAQTAVAQVMAGVSTNVSVTYQ